MWLKLWKHHSLVSFGHLLLDNYYLEKMMVWVEIRTVFKLHNLNHIC